MVVKPQKPHYCLSCGKPLYYSYNASFCKECQNTFIRRERIYKYNREGKLKHSKSQREYYQKRKKILSDYPKTYQLILKIEKLKNISDEEKNEIIKNIYRKYYVRQGKLKEIT